MYRAMGQMALKTGICVIVHHPIQNRLTARPCSSFKLSAYVKKKSVYPGFGASVIVTMHQVEAHKSLIFLFLYMTNSAKKPS